jgi:hypothetical protein
LEEAVRSARLFAFWADDFRIFEREVWQDVDFLIFEGEVRWGWEFPIFEGWTGGMG